MSNRSKERKRGGSKHDLDKCERIHARKNYSVRLNLILPYIYGPDNFEYEPLTLKRWIVNNTEIIIKKIEFFQDF